MPYSTSKRTSTGTDIIYTGRLGYPRVIGFVLKKAPDVFLAEGGADALGEYRSLYAAKCAVIASFERLGGRLGKAA